MSDIEEQRKYYERMMDEVGTEYRRRISDLQAENEKLLELVRDMVRWMPCPKPCSRCERYKYPEGCEFDIRRRELGVEV